VGFVRGVGIQRGGKLTDLKIKGLWALIL